MKMTGKRICRTLLCLLLGLSCAVYCVSPAESVAFTVGEATDGTQKHIVQEHVSGFTAEAPERNSVTGHAGNGHNAIEYCLKAIAAMMFGEADYKNSYTIRKDEGGNPLYYGVSTVVDIEGTELLFEYSVTNNGVVQFDFSKNNFPALLWRGGGMTLAGAVYKQAADVDRDFLVGRTVGGLYTELQGHWLLYRLTGLDRARVADMGAREGAVGYDGNAWVWETANALKTACKIGILALWAECKTTEGA